MEMRAEIIKLQERLGVTTFYVTHDQVEALSMGDRIVVMRDGRIQQVGSPTELYEQPKNTYVASFIGSPPMNFLEGRIDGDRILLPAEKAVLGENGAIRRALVGAAAPEIMLGIRPEHIVLSDEPAGPTRSASPAPSTPSNPLAIRRSCGRRRRRNAC